MKITNSLLFSEFPAKNRLKGITRHFLILYLSNAQIMKSTEMLIVSVDNI